MLEKVSLFSSKKEFLSFLAFSLVVLFISLSFEFYQYKKFTAFDSQLVNVQILKQYSKTKLSQSNKKKTYQVLKLKTQSGLTFYTTASKELPNIKHRRVQMEIWAGEISFYEYMRTFFAFSKIIEVSQDSSFKNALSQAIKTQHTDENISAIYEALYLAKPLNSELQKVFSNLGISHLVAISGFHLGVLSALLFFLFKLPYKFFQNRYFPYRSYKIDSFIFISFVLLSYLLFLDSPPSLLRAFIMLVIGFILYDRGLQIISMQTLLLTVILILAFFPRLIFSLGFFLSSAGVFYIFLFLVYFRGKSKLLQFLLLPLWIYIMMLPYSIIIFENFSPYHPFSIFLTSLFTLFYPLSILFHILGFGAAFDSVLEYLLRLDLHAVKIVLSSWWLYLSVLFSLLTLIRSEFIYLLLAFDLLFFIKLINYVT